MKAPQTGVLLSEGASRWTATGSVHLEYTEDSKGERWLEITEYVRAEVSLG